MLLATVARGRGWGSSYGNGGKCSCYKRRLNGSAHPRVHPSCRLDPRALAPSLILRSPSTISAWLLDFGQVTSSFLAPGSSPVNEGAGLQWCQGSVKPNVVLNLRPLLFTEHLSPTFIHGFTEYLPSPYCVAGRLLSWELHYGV